MIIFRDVISGDEMFSDAFKYKESECGFFFEVEGTRVTRSDGFDDALISANASAEEANDTNESAVVTGVDIILNHNLRQTPAFDKKAYMAHIKDYMKALKAKLEESNPDRVAPFTTGVPAVIKKVVGNLKNYEFFTGESMNPEGMVGLLDYREDGVTPFMLFFRDGLIEEKC